MLSISGLLMSFSIFGPFIAIVMGGVFNKIPVDFDGKFDPVLFNDCFMRVLIHKIPVDMQSTESHVQYK